MRQVLGISGSPRKGGNSDVLLRHVLQGVEQAQTPKDGMHLLYPKVIAAKGMVLVCPTHNYNVTAWMKAFIDRLYCFYIFDTHRPRGWTSRLDGQNRKAVVCAVCEQKSKKDMGFTLEAMRRPMEALGYEIVEELAVFNFFDRGKVKKDPETLARAEKLGGLLADLI
ncbi:MAG: NAD(P)H-dependent oxidoreductase [Deltaproteobacteria bacterium]